MAKSLQVQCIGCMFARACSPSACPRYPGSTRPRGPEPSGPVCTAHIDGGVEPHGPGLGRMWRLFLVRQSKLCGLIFTTPKDHLVFVILLLMQFGIH